MSRKTIGQKNANTGGISYAEYLPWEEIFPDGTVLTKDSRLMACWRVDFMDSSTDRSVSDEVAEKVTRYFRGLETGASFWFTMHRIPSAIRVNPSAIAEMDPYDRAVEEYRNTTVFGDKKANLRNVWYASASWKVELTGNGISRGDKDKAEELFANFEIALGTIGADARRLGCVADSSSDNRFENIYSFLGSCANAEPKNLRGPENGITDCSYQFVVKSLDEGQPMILGGEKCIQVLTFKGWPSHTYSSMLMPLLSLKFPFIWSTRWVPKSNYDSIKIGNKLETAARSATKSWKDSMYEASSGKDSGHVDAQAATDTKELQEVLGSLTKGETMGNLTSTVTLTAEDPKVLEDMRNKVLEKMRTVGFDAIVEGPTGNFPAWLGTMPGDTKHCLRRPFLTASNVADMMPFTTVYHGSPVNHYLKLLTGCGYPHVVGRTLTGEQYYLNLNGPKDDIGHHFMVGATGGGKSVLIALLGSQWMRYPGARFILFDKDRSFSRVCNNAGGQEYIPCDENSKLRFMPLSRIREKPSDAQQWVETVVRACGTTLTDEMSADISAICRGWDESIPTVERFADRLNGRRPTSPVLGCLKRILNDDDLSKLFNGEKDEFNAKSFGRMTMIEMGKLMNLGDLAIYPALHFIFSRLDELFDQPDNPPTIVFMDEAWVFINHPLFRNKIKEWLKTLRKKHVFVGFAVQNIKDIDDPEEFITSCHTKIYLPNPDIGDSQSELFSVYRKFGLSDSEIDIISKMERKREYFISQPEGSTVVDFCVDKWTLSKIARDGR